MIKIGDKSVRELSVELEIAESILYRWIKQYDTDKGEAFPGEGHLKPSEEEVRKLRKKLADVTEERDILKKANKHLLQRPEKKYDFIVSNKARFSVEKMCRILGVSRSGYYKRKKNGKSKRAIDQERLLEKITEIYYESRGLYGSPRISAELKRRGESCDKKRIARIMQESGIRAKTVKRYRRTTNSNHNEKVADNRLNQSFIVHRPNKVWVSDITYIRTKEGWLYLAAILDLYSRRVIGWRLDKDLGSDLVLRALQRALEERKIEEGIIFHSDRGVQYASGDMRKMLTENKIIQSMSRKGNCYDNAVVESFFHTLKTEHINFEKYETREQAKLSIFNYIELFYNRKRLHSTLGYRSPVEFEKTES
ncbi:MAG: IS3 family transposase [Halobacillus sp.]